MVVKVSSNRMLKEVGRDFSKQANVPYLGVIMKKMTMIVELLD